MPRPRTWHLQETAYHHGRNTWRVRGRYVCSGILRTDLAFVVGRAMVEMVRAGQGPHAPVVDLAELVSNNRRG